MVKFSEQGCGKDLRCLGLEVSPDFNSRKGSVDEIVDQRQDNIVEHDGGDDLVNATGYFQKGWNERPQGAAGHTA